MLARSNKKDSNSIVCLKFLPDTARSVSKLCPHPRLPFLSLFPFLPLCQTINAINMELHQAVRHLGIFVTVFSKRRFNTAVWVLAIFHCWDTGAAIPCANKSKWKCTPVSTQLFSVKSIIYFKLSSNRFIFTCIVQCNGSLCWAAYINPASM